MGFNCGIIGLPNVGKSTIFNALSGAGAQMANYPFCTIEPNKGIVPVPDLKLNKIAEILNKMNPIPTKIEFIDVAGLVKGASEGEGLGNKFLDNIRNVDAIIHVVRCFSNEDVVHVTGEVNPINDIEIINTELILSDLDVLERVKEKNERLIRSGDKEAKQKLEIVEKLILYLDEGKLLKSIELSRDESKLINEFGLITVKPILYLANIDENKTPAELIETISEYASNEGSEFLCLIGKLEEEISELPADEKSEFLNEMGLEKSGLDRLIFSAYKLLNLITYYTSATDLQAWTLKKGVNAHEAAGKIHTDFKKGFIRAEVLTYNDLIKSGSENVVKEKGLLKTEGKEYIIQEGDIVRYLFNI